MLSRGLQVLKWWGHSKRQHIKYVFFKWRHLFSLKFDRFSISHGLNLQWVSLKRARVWIMTSFTERLSTSQSINTSLDYDVSGGQCLKFSFLVQKWKFQIECFDLNLSVFTQAQEIHGISDANSWTPHNQVHPGDNIRWKHFPRYWPFVWGIHRSPVNSPHKGQWRGALMVFFFFDLLLNKRLSKQSWGWWFEMPSCPLWCHCNVTWPSLSCRGPLYLQW